MKNLEHFRKRVHAAMEDYAAKLADVNLVEEAWFLRGFADSLLTAKVTPNLSITADTYAEYYAAGVKAWESFDSVE